MRVETEIYFVRCELTVKIYHCDRVERNRLLIVLMSQRPIPLQYSMLSTKSFGQFSASNIELRLAQTSLSLSLSLLFSFPLSRTF